MHYRCSVYFMCSRLFVAGGGGITWLLHCLTLPLHFAGCLFLSLRSPPSHSLRALRLAAHALAHTGLLTSLAASVHQLAHSLRSFTHRSPSAYTRSLAHSLTRFARSLAVRSLHAIIHRYRPSALQPRAYQMRCFCVSKIQTVLKSNKTCCCLSLVKIQKLWSVSGSGGILVCCGVVMSGRGSGCGRCRCGCG